MSVASYVRAYGCVCVCVNVLYLYAFAKCNWVARNEELVLRVAHKLSKCFREAAAAGGHQTISEIYKTF